jgi:hypothetical protein
VGRTLVANRLLAGTACDKRHRARPLNAIVSCHCEPMSKLCAAIDLEPTSQALVAPVASAEAAQQTSQRRGSGVVAGRYFMGRRASNAACWLGVHRRCSVEAFEALTANNAFERTVRHRGASVPRSILIAWLRQRASWPAAQLGR